MPTAVTPSSHEAEKQVLGNVFLEPSYLVRIMPEVEPDAFWYEYHKTLYDLLCDMAVQGDPISVNTVISELKTKSSEIEPSRIKELVVGVDTEERDYWKDVLLNKYNARKLLTFSEEVKQAALSNDDIVQARNKLEEKLVSLSGQEETTTVSAKNSVSELDEVIQKYMEDPDAISGMETGFDRFDRATDGSRYGNVTIFYAPSSRFKSLFVTNIGWNFANKGYRGLWFTTEMPRVQVMERLLQIESGLNIKDLRKSRELFQHSKELRESKDALADLPIFFCDVSALDVSSVRGEVGRHKRWNNIDYIIVDLVDHVHSSRYKDEMVNNQRMVMAGMKSIAKDFGIHVILVSHIAKQEKSMRDSADLDVEDMTGSAAKYQDVDTAVSIMPVKYRTNKEGELKLKGLSREEIVEQLEETRSVQVLISITKNRHGELLRDNMILDFNEGGRFREMDQEDIYELTNDHRHDMMKTWKDRTVSKRKHNSQIGYLGPDEEE